MGPFITYVTKRFRKNFYWGTGVTIRIDISSTVQHNTFLSDYKYSYII